MARRLQSLYKACSAGCRLNEQVQHTAAFPLLCSSSFVRMAGGLSEEARPFCCCRSKSGGVLLRPLSHKRKRFETDTLLRRGTAGLRLRAEDRYAIRDATSVPEDFNAHRSKPSRGGSTNQRPHRRQWTYLYRTMDSVRQHGRFPALVIQRRGCRKGFLQLAVAQADESISVDGHLSYPAARLPDLQRSERLGRHCEVRRTSPVKCGLLNARSGIAA